LPYRVPVMGKEAGLQDECRTRLNITGPIVSGTVGERDSL
jgi:hypothetical protein